MAKLAQLPDLEGRPEGAAADPHGVPRLRTRYYAFLSYSHKDKQLADWLHRELEKFRVPHALAGKLTANGVIPRRLTPIFRDEHDLSAGVDLAVEIEAALAASQFLIVLCSPTAAASRWTNLEIESFKRTRPEGCVLAAVLAGEPFASSIRGREDEECFPPALRYKYDRRGRPTAKRADPLAADFRDAGEGKRLAFLKLVAGMLGVGLDELVQRETTRRHRRLAWLAAASLGGMAVTSTLAVTAIEARDSAREQRREAEGLVAFMLGDLKDKLEPIGRLDALDGVGAKVLAYYSKQDTGQLSDAALVQRSRALSLMGQVAFSRGELDKAQQLYREAATGTAEAVSRASLDPQPLFDHAQNIFYLGYISSQRGQMDQAEARFREYKQLAQRMIALDANNMKWRMEEQDADANLGIVLFDRRQFREAASLLGQAAQMTKAFATADPRNQKYQQDLAEILAWLADAEMADGQISQAITVREQHVALLKGLIAQPQSDVEYRKKLVPSEQTLGQLYMTRGQTAMGLEHLRAAVAAAAQLVPIEPTNRFWQEDAASAHLALAEGLLDTNEREAATAQNDAGCAIFEHLLSQDSTYPSWRAGARSCWRVRASLALAAGRADEAVRDAQRAVAIAVTVKTSDTVQDRYALAKADLILGDAQRALGNASAAIDSWQRALGRVGGGAAEKPFEMDEHATILQRLGRGTEAQALIRRLAAMGFQRSAT